MAGKQPNQLVGRLAGYRRQLSHSYSMWRHRRCQRRNNRLLDSWIRHILKNPPDVFVGPDLPSGGVRGHVRAIRSHSGLKVMLVPDERFMRHPANFTDEIRDRFMAFEPAGSPVLHSHVSPWMIRWCRHRQPRLKWVHTYHLPYFPEHSHGQPEAWQLKINEALVNEACYADIRLSVSKWQQRFLHERHGIETEYLPNGVDVQACDRGDATRFRRRTGITAAFILYVGRNNPIKNPADFVRLAQRIPDQLFVMIGAGLGQRISAEELGLTPPENLLFCGEAAHSEVQDAIAACAAVVVTSKREGLPTLVLETMAHSKPIVVPDESGCMEAIGHGEFGFIYCQGDLDDLEGKAIRAVGDTWRVSRSRDHVLREYDWRVVAPRLDSIYLGSG